ncbi:MAG: transposase [Candidatus Omnitrophota bacterium]
MRMLWFILMRGQGRTMPGNRGTIRLKNYDYTKQGAYYVTVCVTRRKCIFGDVRDGEMVLKDAGRMAGEWWQKLPLHFPNIEMDEYIIMPNHLHGIIIVGAPLVGALNDDGTGVKNDNRAGTRPAPTLGRIIGALKSITTNEYIRNVKTRNWPPFEKRLWQRGYYEHVIRNEHDLVYIREYITTNPAKWEEDEYYPG